MGRITGLGGEVSYLLVSIPKSLLVKDTNKGKAGGDNFMQRVDVIYNKFLNS